MFLKVCKETFHKSRVRMSHKVKSVLLALHEVSWPGSVGLLTVWWYLSCIQTEFPISLQKLCCCAGKKQCFDDENLLIFNVASWRLQQFDFTLFSDMNTIFFCYFFPTSSTFAFMVSESEKSTVNIDWKTSNDKKNKGVLGGNFWDFYYFFSYGNGGTRSIYLEIEFKKNFRAYTCALKKSTSPCWAGSFVCVHMENFHLT